MKSFQPHQKNAVSKTLWMRILTRRNTGSWYLLSILLSALLFLPTSSCSVSLAGDVTPQPGAAVVQSEAQIEVTPTQIQIASTSTPLPTAIEHDEELTEEKAPNVEHLNFQINALLVGELNTTSDEELFLELQGFEGMQLVSSQKADVNVEGKAEFTEVFWQPGLVYVVTLEYQGLFFSSDMLPVENIEAGAVVDLPVVVYETTHETDALAIDRVHIFVNVLSEDMIQIVAYLMGSNLSDQVVAPREDGSPVLSYKIPEDALNLQFEDSVLGERYLAVDQGFGDLSIVQPGRMTYELLYAYDLPYQRKKSVAVEFPLPVSSLLVAMPADGLKLKNDQLVDGGLEDVDGQSIQMYNLAELPANTSLILEISGKAATGSSAASDDQWVYGAAVFALVLAAILFWYFRWRGKKQFAQEPQPEKGKAELIDEIIALDAEYETGEMEESIYQNQRQELKQKLRDIVEKKGKHA